MALSLGPKYWIGVVSREHVLVGSKDGFCQVCHGKQAPLKRMQKDDWLIYYSPKESMDGNVACQKFTAIGKIADEKIYPFEMFPGFVPFRRNVTYLKNITEVPIRPLLDKLSFSKDTKNWGMKLRFGLFEITKEDFELIHQRMTSTQQGIKRLLEIDEKKDHDATSIPKKTRLDQEKTEKKESIEISKDVKLRGNMDIELTHTEFSLATAANVWKMWSDVSTWSQWDHGVEWCKLKDGQKFEVNAEATLKPKGAPFPVSMRLTECTPNKSFTDVGTLELGSLEFKHEVVSHKNGVNITHTVRFVANSPHTQAIFEQRMLPKLKQELPESVKSLAKLAEAQSK